MSLEGDFDDLAETKQPVDPSASVQPNKGIAMYWRTLGFVAAGVLVAIMIIGGAYFGLIRGEPLSLGRSILAPAQPSPTPLSQWIPLPTILSGQPTPTIPAGAFIFRNPMGNLVLYMPAAVTPTPMAWQTYSNQQEGYSINYPSDWIKVDAIGDSQRGFSLYPPGTNLQENVPGGHEKISIGLMDGYRPPNADDRALTSMQTITVDDVTGYLYTAGVLGKSITAAFPRKTNYLVLEAYLGSGSETLIDVFQQILSTLKLF